MCSTMAQGKHRHECADQLYYWQPSNHPAVVFSAAQSMHANEEAHSLSLVMCCGCLGCCRVCDAHDMGVMGMPIAALLLFEKG